MYTQLYVLYAVLVCRVHNISGLIILKVIFVTTMYNCYMWNNIQNLHTIVLKIPILLVKLARKNIFYLYVNILIF